MEPVSRSPTTADRLLTVGKMAGLGALGIGIGFVTAILLALSLEAAGIPVLDQPLALTVISLVSVQGIGLSVVGLVYLSYTGYGLGFVHARIPTLRDIGWVVGGFFVMIVVLIVVAYVIQFITQATGIETASNSTVDQAREDPSVLLILIPAAFLVIGPAEELLFRGIVQGRLREVFSTWPAIVLASAIFGALHLVALSGGSGDVLSVLLPVTALTVLSVVFGIAYERTENLVVPSLIHGAYDAFLFSLLYISLVYSDELEAAANNSSALLTSLF